MNPDGRTNAREVFNDTAAAAALRSRLLHYALRNLSEADAEDATQETLLALLAAPDGYRGTAQFDTYAHAVLRHKTVDVYRTHARELPHAPETIQAAIDRASETGSDADPQNDPAEQIDARRQAQWFWTTLGSCLRELPDRTRAVFELRTLLEIDLPVVCRQLGITRNHGGVLAHRARAHIRRRWPAAAA
ncbi:MAG: sigma-70 family RNA polymerase sigma factor [Pseudomonadota bacterium]|nr:sigma-70 family RNA polymerase sigma factor [Burkholderiaceae bacterium]MDQ3445128.1 sigma-70 family RNA polymerase sigma factor [Pseudomonadota bacterium]